MKGEFVIWTYKTVKHASAVKLAPGSGFRDTGGALRNGLTLEQTFPTGVRLTMPADRPMNTLLPDNVYNVNMMIVASRRLKEFLARQALPGVEYLPVVVINHKGDPVLDPFFIVHPVNHLDCVDEEQSVFRRSDIDDSYEHFDRMVIDANRVPPDRQLFRINGYWDATLIRRTFADALARGKFSGLAFEELPADT